ncbi:sigma factor-like helix-turn-helix DNA-binding protein [Rhodococcus chondri]|uniref:sigma factor-like helix-turn-helix DNA-binding protein n=1 Tax=Rhodococcus chondri TaxID=3065941 RepID=UPI0038B58932
MLREFAQLTYAEIAEHQQIPVQTVKSRINRGRTRLLEALTPTHRGSRSGPGRRIVPSSVTSP